MTAKEDVIVFLEGGTEKKVAIARGLVAEARRIASSLGGTVHAMTVGEPGNDADAPEAYGISTLFKVEGKGLTPYSYEASAWAAITALGMRPFRLFLLAATDMGNELAPRVAAGLNTAAVLNCADVRPGKNGVAYAKRIHGGQLEEEATYSRGEREIATIVPEALDRVETTSVTAPVVLIPIEVPVRLFVTRSHEPVPPDPDTVDILYAKRIVAVGSGCTRALGPAEELAHLLDAAIATTRPLVDDGLIPKSRMVGQTGKTVGPDLYVALGLSGSPHHVAGMQGSKEVLSVDLDPRAPIFGFSDTGYTADVNTFLPKLVDRIKRFTEGGS